MGTRNLEKWKLICTNQKFWGQTLTIMYHNCSTDTEWHCRGKNNSTTDIKVTIPFSLNRWQLQLIHHSFLTVRCWKDKLPFSQLCLWFRLCSGQQCFLCPGLHFQQVSKVSRTSLLWVEWNDAIYTTALGWLCRRYRPWLNNAIDEPEWLMKEL